MKRRRYTPSAEGLEPRELLASAIFNPKNPFGSFDPTPVLPNTLEEKAQRIERLPFYMQQFQEGRVIPPNVMTNIQNDLRGIVTKLTPPSSALLTQYNHTIRGVLPHSSLSQASVGGLNNIFGRILANAGAPAGSVASFQTDMTALANADAKSVNPAILAANDYTVVLEIALGVGQPLARPKVPSLLAADRIDKNAHATTVAQPTFVGSYDPGATIQIVDDRGFVLGSGVVEKNGQYAIQASQPLAPGAYVLAARAFDNGILSPPSPTFRLKVIAPKHPKA
jgi:hypothetical protein